MSEICAEDRMDAISVEVPGAACDCGGGFNSGGGGNGVVLADAGASAVMGSDTMVWVAGAGEGDVTEVVELFTAAVAVDDVSTTVDAINESSSLSCSGSGGVSDAPLI